MHLDGFNLNLLVAFDTLATSPTLTAAAKRLSLSQPALSGALRKLREAYDDPLIVYTSTGSRLTPVAERLAPMVRQMLVMAGDTLKIGADFDPAKAKVHFEVRAADWVQTTFLRDLLGRVAVAAPQVEMCVQSLQPRPAAFLFREAVDLVLTSRLFLSSDHSSEMLFEDAFACIAWEGNAHVAEGVDEATFVRLDHAGLAERADGVSPPELAFRDLAIRRRVRIRTSVHALLPHIIVGTDLLAVTSRRFAEMSAASLPIRVMPLPVPVPPIAVFAQWQPYRDNDPAMLWLRQMLRDQAAQMLVHQPDR